MPVKGLILIAVVVLFLAFHCRKEIAAALRAYMNLGEEEETEEEKENKK